ncbi:MULTISPECIES: CesT family type III secretion system chaperone [unclassified Brenneria]|uniref:CesT family type III secretion system chaperone n=1 Tax=unclassified Brenneria TaxID=2634434 RepID=UPI001551FB47|nr:MULTISPECIES: CesT family type III secretion system chaperone [unclassified Brenneria]MBJ7222210.1 CesT family type III secretion system chaperone [Brenneria sp. L3-3C-1]MEE3643453.1 CesT family type III secretion system chaperone [Brenneria sp. L3_3C_1]MEE3651637.1 CesT family type III secretion system chaperone [Brenneria sp. HEZEL_4_2_4]NPD01594.1 type III chaperone protein ShcA [Brenneria sp. hezel4-2-4]
MSQLFYDTLLCAFADRLKMARLRLDKKGVCDLVVDNEIPLRLQQDARNQRLLLIALLGDVVNHNPQVLLEANLNLIRGDNLIIIAADPSVKQFYACHAIEQSILTAELLLRKIAELVDYIRFWRNASQA